MMALVGVIGISVLNHFPGNTLSSLIGQSGNSASARWAVFLLHFLQLQQEDRGNRLREFSQSSCLLQLIQENLEGSGFPWGLIPGFCIQVVDFSCNITTSFSHCQKCSPAKYHPLSFAPSLCFLGFYFNELDLFLYCVVGREGKERRQN